MKFGVVTGTVTATAKDESFDGVKLLLLQPVDENRAPYGSPIVACDATQAGEGDLVAFESGREAAVALSNWFNPSDATVMAIIDSVNVREFVK